MTANDQDFSQAAEELERYIQESPAFERHDSRNLTGVPYLFALPGGLAFMPQGMNGIQNEGAGALTDDEKIDQAIPQALKDKLAAEHPAPPADQELDIRNPKAIWTAFLKLALNSLCKADGALYNLLKNKNVDTGAVMGAIKKILQNSAQWQAAITMAVIQVIAMLLLRFSASLVCTLKGYQYPPPPAPTPQT